MIPTTSAQSRRAASPEAKGSTPETEGDSDDRSLATVGSATGGLAAAAAAFVAALCCVGPSTVAVLGAGGALAAASIKPYRPYLLLASLAMILYGFWRTYGAGISSAHARACPTRTGRLIRGSLWLAALVWTGALILFIG